MWPRAAQVEQQSGAADPKSASRRACEQPLPTSRLSPPDSTPLAPSLARGGGLAMRPEAPRPSSPRIQRGDKGGNEMTLSNPRFWPLAQCVVLYVCTNYVQAWQRPYYPRR